MDELFGINIYVEEQKKLGRKKIAHQLTAVS
jgi:hypothetical protein